MKTLPFDERIEWLEAHIAQFILDKDWDSIDQYIGECDDLSGMYFQDWLVDLCEPEMALEIEAGVNLHLHADKAATDYVDHFML